MLFKSQDTQNRCLVGKYSSSLWGPRVNASVCADDKLNGTCVMCVLSPYYIHI